VGIVGLAYRSQRKVAWCRADQWSNATTMLPSSSQNPLMEQQLAADIGRKCSVISSPKPRNIEASATSKAR